MLICITLITLSLCYLYYIVPNIDNSEINITWIGPDRMKISIGIPRNDQNGILLSYTLKYNLINNPEVYTTYIPNGENDSLIETLSDLMNGSLYEIQYRANTSIGGSDYSTAVNFRTLPSCKY